jgi:fused signal recognition particle receptor
MGFLDKFGFEKLRDGLSKTRQNILDRITGLIKGYPEIDEGFLMELEEILISADVGVNMTMKIIDNLKERIRRDRIKDLDEINFILKKEIEGILKLSDSSVGDPFEIPGDGKRPYVIMIVGVNGVGKTTTIGKLAFNYRTRGRRVLLGATDTFRAAANEQLEIWAKRAGVDMIRQHKGSDPGAVAFDTLKSAIAKDIEELKKIKRVISKVIPDAPHEIWLVLDATIGQNAIQQARQFMQAVNITGLIITKLDGTAKGGVVLAIMDELKIPVKFIGVGERIEDLQPFDKEAFIEALFEK